MFSFNSLARAPTLLFSGALLTLVMGFGMFFDHLAETHEVRQRQLAQQYVYAQPDQVAQRSRRPR